MADTCGRTALAGYTRDTRAPRLNRAHPHRRMRPTAVHYVGPRQSLRMGQAEHAGGFPESGTGTRASSASRPLTAWVTHPGAS